MTRLHNNSKVDNTEETHNTDLTWKKDLNTVLLQFVI